MIHFYLDANGKHGWNKCLIFFSNANSIAQMWEDLLTQPCVIIVNLQNILKIRLDDIHHAS